MHAECLVAEYESLEKARIGLEVLDTFHFTLEEVSVITQADTSGLGQLGTVQRDKPHDEGGKSVGLGALIGAGIATPIAVSTLVGPFFLAGPIAGLVGGAAVRAILAPTESWGITEAAADHYQRRVETGSVLIIVTAEGYRATEAESGLRTTDLLSLERFATTNPPSEEERV